MSTVVRLLDRQPGEKPKREVAGFLIEENIPPPAPLGRRAALREVMSVLEVNQSILVSLDYDKSEIYLVAKEQKGKTFTLKKFTNGYRVWRTA